MIIQILSWIAVFWFAFFFIISMINKNAVINRELLMISALFLIGAILGFK